MFDVCLLKDTGYNFVLAHLSILNSENVNLIMMRFLLTI